MSNRHRISTKDAQEILLATGDWANIVEAADSYEINRMVRLVAINVRDTIKQTSVIRMDDDEVAYSTLAAIQILVDASIITQSTQEKLIALSENGSEGYNDITVYLQKGHPVRGTNFVVLNTGEYKMNELVECARVDAPDISYGAFICSLIAEGN